MQCSILQLFANAVSSLTHREINMNSNGNPVDHIFLIVGDLGFAKDIPFAIAWFKNGEEAIRMNFVAKRTIKPSKTMEITTTGIPPQIYEPDATYSYALYIDGKPVEPDYSKTTDNRSEQ